MIVRFLEERKEVDFRLDYLHLVVHKSNLHEVDLIVIQLIGNLNP